MTLSQQWQRRLVPSTTRGRTALRPILRAGQILVYKSRPYINTLSFLSFSILVLFPTVLGATYWEFFASRQYATEIRLAVRASQPAHSASDLIARFFGSQTNSSAGKDAYIVANYIRSRNIVRVLNADGSLRRMYSRPTIDYFSRFDAKGSDDELWKYLQDKLTSSVDRFSGVVTVTVIAFGRQDALTVAQKVMRLTDTMTNRYSERMRSEFLKFARNELMAATHHYRSALLAIRNFRDIDRVIDPVMETESIAKSLLNVQLSRAGLEQEKAAAERTLSPSAPTIRILQSRIEATDVQIKKLQHRLTASSDYRSAASAALAKFDALNLDRLFAEKQLTLSKQTYRNAVLDAERQHMYLVEFLKPRLPDESSYPRVGTNIALTFTFALLAWATLRLIVAGALDAML